MSQGEVYDYLTTKERLGKWFSAKEIGEVVPINLQSIRLSCKKLRKSGVAEYRKVRPPHKQVYYEYRVVRRPKIKQ